MRRIKYTVTHTRRATGNGEVKLAGRSMVVRGQAAEGRFGAVMSRAVI